MVDIALFTVKAGNGGNGRVSFLREKYMPKGGPDGGDGGRGGSVYLTTEPNDNTLRDYAGKTRFAAPDGEPGGKRQMSGSRSNDLVLVAPVGTLVWELFVPELPHKVELTEILRESPEMGRKRLLGELLNNDDHLLLARGGEGGRGNERFKSSVNRTPMHAEEGTPGEERVILLELKLLADVGFVGYPNAGKSTLLAALTAARPKIANYPFTTLEPNLGVVEVKHANKETTRMVIADIPGLIEGASEGKGLGHDFLRHVERCRVLVYVLNPEENETAEALEAQLNALKKELKDFRADLADRTSLVVINKGDLFEDSDLEEMRAGLEQRIGQKVFGISAAGRAGLDTFQEELISVFHASKPPEPQFELDEEAQLPVYSL